MGTLGSEYLGAIYHQDATRVLCWLHLTENEETRREPSAIEEFITKCYHSLNEITLDQFLTDAPFFIATEENALWHYHCHAAIAWCHTLHHVLNPRIVTARV